MTASSSTIPAGEREEHSLSDRNRRLGLILAGVVATMILLSPVMYWTGGMLCTYLGVGWNPGGSELSVAADPGSDQRQIRVEFTAVVDPELRGRLTFRPDDTAQIATVGRPDGGTTTFSIRNDSDRTVYLLPTHHVSPPAASRKFIMTKCFCYNKMKLEPGESRRLDLVYGFDADMDARIARSLVNYHVAPITRADYEEWIEQRPEAEGSIAAVGGAE